MRRRDVLGVAGAQAVLAGCRQHQKGPRVLRVALLPRFTLAPLYLADELGYFAEAGITIEPVPMAQSMHLLPLLAAGKADVGFTAVTPGLVNAVARGARLRIVAARDMAVSGCTTGGTVFASARTFPGGLHDLRQLKGRRVVMSNQAGIMTFFMDQLLKSAGMTRKDFEVVPLRSADGVAVLLAGKVDALVAANLDKDLDLVSNKIVRGPSFADKSPNFQYTFILFGKSMLEGDRRTAVGFLAAYLRGLWGFQAGKNPKALKDLAEAAHSDLTAVQSACRSGFAHDGRVNLEHVRQVVDWSIGQGMSSEAPSMDQLVDNSMIEEAYKVASGRSAR